MQNAVRLSGVAVDMKAVPVVHADGSVLMPGQWRWRAGLSARHLHWQVGQPERFLYLLLSRFSLSIWELRRLMIAVVAPPKTAAARPVAAAFSPGDQTELSAILLLLRFPRELVVFPVTKNANRGVCGRPCRRTHGTTHGVGCTEGGLGRILRGEGEAGLRQEELAEASGVRPPTVSDLERGVAVTPQRKPSGGSPTRSA
jgi:Helix-turn-helix